MAAPSCTSGPPAEPLSDVEYDILKVSEGIVRLYERHQDDIWPGYSLAERPFLAYIRDKWALLLNAGEGVEGFGPYPEGWPDLGTNALLHRGQYGDLVGQLAFDLSIDGMKTLAVGFPAEFPASIENPEAEAFGTIVHEAFHQYQHEAFGDIAWAREERYPVHDRENSALAYLEMRILMDAVESTKSGDRDRLRGDMERFVAVRNHRWARAKPFVSSYEQGQEIREGTARYVEMKSIELLTGLEYESSLEGLTRPLSESFQSVSMPEHLLSDFRDRMAEGYIRVEDMLRNRIYPVGCAQGYLLDHLGIDWKKRAEEAGPEFTFERLFSEALGLEESASADALSEAKRRYDYERILTATAKEIEGHLERYREELAAFESQPGYRMEVEIPYKSLSRSRVSRAKKWVVDEGARTLCSQYKVYTLKNDRLNLQAHDTGILEEDDWVGKRRKVVLYLPEIPSINLEGTPFTPSGMAPQSFDRIEVAAEGFKLSSTQSGTVVAASDRVNIRLAL